MKVSIIGGGGLVGSSAAFALQCGGLVSQIDLIDLNADQVRGQALDLLHGASLVADQRIRATGYEAIPESDVIIITAGLSASPTRAGSISSTATSSSSWASSDRPPRPESSATPSWSSYPIRWMS